MRARVDVAPAVRAPDVASDGASCGASDRRRARRLLVIGAAAGFAIALVSIVRRPGPTLSADAAAVVDGVTITESEVERALGALAADRRARMLGPGDRRRVLDRLVDEELLVARARELGLDRLDRGVRARLVQSMVEAVLAEASAERSSDADASASGPPNDAEAEAFYRANLSFFTPIARVSIRVLGVSAARQGEAEARARAAEAARRLRTGESFDAVAADLGDAGVAAVPNGPLPPAKVADYLGPTLAELVAASDVGRVSDPVLVGSTVHVLEVVEREFAEPPPFAAVRDEVVREMRRRGDDRALRTYLDGLRSRATIRFREP